MKYKNWLSQITAASLTFMLAVCSVGCLVTGFALNVSFGRILLCAGLFTVVCVLSFRLRHGGLIPLGMMAVAAGYLWRKGELMLQLQSLLLNITSRYHGAYSTGRLCVGAPNGINGPVDIPLAVLGCLVVMAVCWAVVRRKSASYVLLATLPPLIACLVVTDTPPNALALYGLLLGNMCLLITDWVRRQGRDNENRLLARMILCAAAALGVLFLMNPKDSYVNRSGDIQGHLISLAERLQSFAEELGEEVAVSGETAGSDQVNLRVLGPRTQWGYSVMEVTSPVSGAVYLRGQDYNTYNGTGWVSSRHRSEDFSVGSGGEGELKIRTYGVKPVIYVPYYPSEAMTMVSGCMKNEEDVTRYSFSYSAAPTPGLLGIPSDVYYGYDSYTQNLQYRQLPPDTLSWAKEMVEPLIADAYSLDDKVEAIREFVSASARYDLNTARMSREYTDFARWFLEESDTGYCVHFATSATVLLRAAGIQARYVEGFAIRCEAGETVVVTGRSAHAWTEYYDSSVDAWRILEATPADVEDTGIENPTERREPLRDTETAQTEPEQTTEPEESASGTAPEEPETPAEPPRKTNFKLPGWAKVMGWLLMAAAAVWVQSALRIRWKRDAWNRGGANEQALNRWRQVKQLARIIREEVPEELQMLAQKAKFSQHTLSDTELQRFDVYRRQCLEKLESKGKAARLAVELLFAIV